MNQLKEFVDRGLIVAEYSKPVMTMAPESNEYHYSQVVTLKLKDQDYIEHLEKENKELRERLKD